VGVGVCRIVDERLIVEVMNINIYDYHRTNFIQ
jgi:hypothetical protein